MTEEQILIKKLRTQLRNLKRKIVKCAGCGDKFYCETAGKRTLMFCTACHNYLVRRSYAR